MRIKEVVSETSNLDGALQERNLLSAVVWRSATEQTVMRRLIIFER